MFLLLVVFIIGVYVGYKYPEQVEKVVEYVKKTFGDLKDKISKKNP